MHRQESKHSIPRTLEQEGQFGKLVNELWGLGVLIGWKDNTLTIIADESVYTEACKAIKVSEGEERIDG